MVRKIHCIPWTVFPRYLLLASMIVWGIGVAEAEPAAPMEWTAEHIDMLASGEPERGQQLADKCDRCHGANGVSDDDEIPHLAGQNKRYIYKQLQDCKSDARDGGSMNKRARRLSNQDMADLAAWYTGLILPAMDRSRDIPPPPVLVTQGDAERSIPACSACHGETGRGINDDYDAPVLAGMPYDYFIMTMTDFQDGTRANDLGGVVRQFAAAITADELKALAEYYLALGRRQLAPLE